MDGLVTVTERKVLLWGVQRLEAKIDEDDSYVSFDHSYSAKTYWIHISDVLMGDILTTRC